MRHESNLIGGEDYEIKIISDSMDTMWPDEEDNEKEKSEEEAESDQSDEKKTNFQSQVDAAVKILGG